MKKRRFKVVTPAEDGGIAVFPMYPWLRKHPGELPSQVDPKSLDDPTKMTSQMLRSILMRAGWIVTETPTEVRLLPPRYRDSTAAETLITDAEEQGESLEVDEADPDESAAVAFRMEQQLHHFVADNLSTVKINGRSVVPFEGSDGRSGLEHSTPAGRIDLLARDDNGSLVIFEFKRARAADAAIGQLTRYMGYLQASQVPGSHVTGVIVAPAISNELRYSARMIPNVHLFEFAMTFSLRSAQDVPT